MEKQAWQASKELQVCAPEHLRGNEGGRGGRTQSPLRKVLCSKDYLDWLKIDLNAAKTITAQDYKQTKN